MTEQHAAGAMVNPVMPVPSLTADNEPPNVFLCQSYRTGRPVTARPMIMRWISEVPSKMVKIVELAAVSAGQRPDGGRGISTDSARAVRGE